MARKKSSMQEEVEKAEAAEVPKGEQMPLIDVGPKNAKEIIKTARQYRAVVKKRIAISRDEVSLKTKLIELVKAENLTPLEDGVIRFSVDGFVITATPRDILLQVKEDSDAEAA